MNFRTGTTSFLWLALVLFVLLTIAFLLPVTPQDYWWYLRLGRDILASAAVPRVDTFTFTQVGAAVDYQSWGAAVLFWLAYRLGGLTLTVLLRGLLLAASYSLVWLTARRAGAGRWASNLILLAGVLASSNNWAMRPQLFAYPLFTLALYLLYRWQAGDRKAVYWLPLLSLLWVNLHGSFVMLVLLVGPPLIFPLLSEKREGNSGEFHPLFVRWLKDRKEIILALAGILLTTLVNPRGLGTWSYIFNSLTAPSSQIFSIEWSPPVNSGWQMNIFFLWLLGSPLLAALSPRKLSSLEWIWFLGFGFLALWGERYVIWFVFLMIVLTARLLSDWEKKYLSEKPADLPMLNLTLGLVFLILPLAVLPGLREKWWAHSPPATENTPIAAAQWLADHPDLPGPLWSEIGFSSYLEFALPERPTWIDTRFELFPVEQWQEYREIAFARYNWSDLLDTTGARLLVVSIQAQADLASALRSAPTWCQLYQDNVAVIYQRCGGQR